jgi:hypothetical protein
MLNNAGSYVQQRYLAASRQEQPLSASAGLGQGALHGGSLTSAHVIDFEFDS